jgi:hypothetical protein
MREVMSDEVNAPPSEPVGEITLPVRMPGSGTYTVKPLMQARVSTGTQIFPVSVALDESNATLHVTLGEDGHDAGGYIVSFVELLQAIADLHERRLGPPIRE